MRLKVILLGLVVIFSVGCGKSLKGRFSCPGGFFGMAAILEFRDGKNVMVISHVMGQTVDFPTTYEYSGNHVYVKHEKGGSLSYVVKDADTLIGESQYVKDVKCTRNK